MFADVRYALRSLRKTPGFAALAVLVLAMGIGLNTAIFSLINAALFAPPPGVQDAATLRYVYLTPEAQALNYNDITLLRSSNSVFAGLATLNPDGTKFGSGGDVQIVAGESVSSNYFDLLGVKAAHGRTFVADDDRPEAPLGVVISDRLWAREFRRDPAILGKIVRLRRPGLAAESQWPDYAVIGIIGPEFRGAWSPFSPTEYWVVNSQRSRDYASPLDGRIGRLENTIALLVIGRFKPDATDSRADVEFTALAAQIRTGDRQKLKEWGLDVETTRRVRLPFGRASGSAVSVRLATGLLAVAGTVLFVATMNLAGMLMARGMSKQAEIAARLTLGASRIRIVGQLLVESFVFAVAGGLGGLVLARLLTLAFLSQTPAVAGSPFGQTAFSLDVPIDARVLAFATVVSFVTAILVTLAPARQAWRTNIIMVLSNGAGSQQTGRMRTTLRQWILVPQVALSVALLVIAGAMGRPLLRAAMVPPGYDPDKVAYVNFNFAAFNRNIERDETLRNQYLQKRTTAYRVILDRVSQLPGLSTAAFSQMPPSASSSTWIVSADSYTANQRYWISSQRVSPDYFTTMGIKLTAGRLFDLGDSPTSPPVAIICERLARMLFPGQNPIGQRVADNWPDSNYPPRWREVVGVVNEIQTPLTDGASPYVYASLTQDVHPYAMTILARGDRPQGDLIREIRGLVAAADADIEIMASGPLVESIDAMAYPRRMATTIISLAGVFGLFLSAVGIYGVVSHSVSQRLREIGIRATLGASRGDLMSLILKEGARIAVIGGAAGIALAFLATKYAASVFAQMPQPDFTSAALAPAVISAAILLACVAPARRAARVDPIVVLRDY